MNGEKRYRSLSDHFRERFSQKVYKLSLSVSDTCPNRDGSKGTGGCIFCSGEGSGDFAEKNLPVTEQIENAKKRVSFKAKNALYCAYFQSFTSTYCDFAKFCDAVNTAVSIDDIVCVSVATRPDCLPENVLGFLEKTNKIKPVYVELGLQTANEKTAEYINRCYTNDVYENAVKNLKMRGINVVTHVILGLPGESEEDMLSTVNFAVKSGTNGIKLQLLHVLKGTRLAEEYEQGKFDILSIEEYAKILSSCIEKLPENIVVHRLTGDGAKKNLIAPLWSADKKSVLNYINKYFDENNIIQGSKV